MIYLDVASTAKYSKVDDIIVDTIAMAMKDSWMNPSSLYAANVKRKIDRCRANVAEFIGAEAEEIYYTSGSSESNNWAIRGWVDYSFVNSLRTPVVITTPIEHKSTLSAVKNAALDAFVYSCDVDKDGVIDNKSLEYLLAMDDNPALVSVCMANNEIGTIQNIKKISNLVHKYNGVLHVDATQAFGHIPINVEELGIDMMSASGHKISPVLKGIGILFKKKCINIHPLIYGSQEDGLRGGTENTFGIIGLNKAIEYCDVRKEEIKYMCNMRDYFINTLKHRFDCKLNGHEESRLPNNINVTFPQDVTGESLLYALDMDSIKIGTGSACNSRFVEPSHVLKAIGLSDEEAMRTVRISISDDITLTDIDFVISEIDKVIRIMES